MSKRNSRNIIILSNVNNANNRFDVYLMLNTNLQSEFFVRLLNFKISPKKKKFS